MVIPFYITAPRHQLIAYTLFYPLMMKLYLLMMPFLQIISQLFMYNNI